MSLVVSLTHTCFFVSPGRLMVQFCQFGAFFSMPYFNIPSDPFEAIGRHLKIKRVVNVACFEFAKMWSSQFLPKPHEIASIFMAWATDDKHHLTTIACPDAGTWPPLLPIIHVSCLECSLSYIYKHYSMPARFAGVEVEEDHRRIARRHEDVGTLLLYRFRFSHQSSYGCFQK